MISRCTWDFSSQSVIDQWLIQQNPTSVGGIFSIHVVNEGSSSALRGAALTSEEPFLPMSILELHQRPKGRAWRAKPDVELWWKTRGTGNIGGTICLCVCENAPPSSGNFTVFSSRKLASASWSPSCLSKVLGGLESPIAWNLILNYPSPSLPGWLVHKQFGCGSIPPWGHRRHVAAGSKFGSIRILSIIVFSCQASFRPLPLGLK